MTISSNEVDQESSSYNSMVEHFPAPSMPLGWIPSFFRKTEKISSCVITCSFGIMSLSWICFSSESHFLSVFFTGNIGLWWNACSQDSGQSDAKRAACGCNIEVGMCRYLTLEQNLPGLRIAHRHAQFHHYQSSNFVHPIICSFCWSP